MTASSSNFGNVCTDGKKEKKLFVSLSHILLDFFDDLLLQFRCVVLF